MASARSNRDDGVYSADTLQGPLHRTIRPILATAFFLLLVAAPLPFGGITRGAAMALELSCFILFSVCLLVHQELGNLSFALAPASAIATLALLGLLQSLSYPEALVRTLSPATWNVYARPPSNHSGDPGASLSLAPDVSRSTALIFTAVACCLLLSAILGRWRNRRHLILLAPVAGAVFQAVFGSTHLYARATTIWGIQVPSGTDRLHGTYIDPDHLATYLLIGLTLTAALALRELLGQRRRETKAMKTLLPCMAFCLIFVALAFTGSRAGIFAAVIALTSEGIAVSLSLKRLRLAPTGALLAILGLAVTAAISIQQGFGRLIGTSSGDLLWATRLAIWHNSLELARTFPLLGTGLGTFREAFPLVQGADLPGTFSHAHNDFLEILVTTGIVGGLLLLVAALTLLHRLLKVASTGNKLPDRLNAAAVLGALMGIAAQETMDFGLVMPATALTLAAVAGAAAAAPLVPRSISSAPT